MEFLISLFIITALTTLGFMLLDILCGAIVRLSFKKFVILLFKGKLVGHYKRVRLTGGDIIYVKFDKHYLPVVVGTNFTFLHTVIPSQQFISRLVHYLVTTQADTAMFKQLISLRYEDFMLKEELPSAYRVLYIKD